MSTQPLAAMLAQHLGAHEESPATSDLQRMLGRVITILSRRRWLFVIPLLTGMLATLVVGLLLPRKYALNTIFERRDDVAISNLVDSNSPYSFETLRRSLVIDVMGYHALGEAADQLGLTDDLPRDEEDALTPAGRAKRLRLLNELADCLRVGVIEKSEHLDLIQINYRGREPEVGLRLVAQLTENYIARMDARLSEILTKSHRFFAAEAEQAKEQAAALEAELLKMSADHPGIDPSDPDLLGQRIIAQQLAIEKLTLDRAETERQLRSKRDYLDALENGLAVGTSEPQAMSAVRQVPNVRYRRIKEQIERVETEIADAQALRRMTDQHPYVVSLRGKLEGLEEELAREPATVPETFAPGGDRTDEPGETHREVERQRVANEIATLQERLDLFDEDLDRQQARLAQLETSKAAMFDRRQQYLVLQQDLDTAKTEHRSWKKHMDEVARVLAAEKRNHGISFAVVEPPRKPRKPIAPTAAGIFLLAGGLGLALAVALVFLAEVFDRSVRDPGQAQRAFGLPVLEVIGEIVPVGSKCRRRWLWPVVAGIEIVGMAAAGTVFLMSLNDPEWYEQVLAYAPPARWMAEMMGA